MPPGDQGKAEAIARSYIPEGAPAPKLTFEQEAAQKVAGELRDSLAKDDPMGGLERTRDVHKDFKIGERLQKKIGTEFTPVTAGTPEADRMDKATKKAELAERFSKAKEGYDSPEITADEKEDLREEIIRSVLDIRPAFRDLDPTEKEAIAIDLLKNPALQEKVATLLDGRLKSIMGEDPKLVEALRLAQTKKQEAERVHTERIKMHEAKKTEKKAVEADIKQFDEEKKDRSGKVTQKEGSLRKRMKLLEASEEEDTTKIDQLKQEGAIRGADPALLRSQTNEALAKSFKVEVVTPQQQKLLELRAAEKNIAELQELRGKLAEWQEKRNNLGLEITQAEKEVVLAQSGIEAAKAEFEAARDKKGDAENDVVDSFDGIIVDAAEDYIQEDIARREQAYKTGIQEKYKSSTDELDQFMTDKMLNRWDSTEKRGKNERHIILRDEVNMDYGMLFEPGGNKIVLRRILADNITARFPGDTPEAKAAQSAEIAKIQQKLDTDPSFVDKWTSEVAARVLTKKLQLGEKLHQGDIRRMLDFKWGDAALNTAIANSSNLSKKIDAIEDAIGGASRLDKLKRATGGNWAAILALFLAFPLGSYYIAKKIKEEGGGA